MTRATFFFLMGMLCPSLALSGSGHEDVERWYVVRISGAAVGFASETEQYGEHGIVFRSHTNLSLRRMGTALSMFMMMEEVDGLDGKFQHARVEMNTSITSAVLDGDSVRIEFESGGHVRRTVVAWEDDAVSMSEGDRLVDEWFLSDAPDVRYKFFSVDDGMFKTVRIERGESKTEIVNGEEMMLRSMIEYEGDANVPVSITWLDENREAVRTVISQMGLEIIVERIDSAEMESIELEPDFDIIRQSMIPVEGYPDPPEGVKDVTVRLHLTHPVPAGQKFEGPNQHEVGRGEDWVELLLSRETVNRITVAPAELQNYLEPGKHIQSDHPSIGAIADSIRAASGAEGWDLAHTIAQWVNDWITGKNFEQGFASALEVLESREGDCTEHSILLTSLLRAAGIPARPAVGLVYHQGALIGHMWSEAYIDHWRSLDALDLRGDPVRIRISGASGSNAVNPRDIVAAYAVAGGMTVRVVDYHLR
ncbi:MAG: transglutaminase domain-containing protein [Candidatus Krumholzibacteriota bacterium]|nr:transglutaminase domain-containing protein [Candidatus Krumholzibacteriota bacterium]